MKGYPKDTSNITILNLSEGQKNILKKQISDAITKLDINSVFSLKSFFDDIKISLYSSTELILGWNEFIMRSKKECTPRIFERLQSLPKITVRQKGKLKNFWQKLQELWVLDGTNPLIVEISGKINSIVQKNSTN